MLLLIKANRLTIIIMRHSIIYNWAFNANARARAATTWFSLKYMKFMHFRWHLFKTVSMQNSRICVWGLRCSIASEKVVNSLKIHVFIWPNQCAVRYNADALTKICLILMFLRLQFMWWYHTCTYGLMYLPFRIYGLSDIENSKQQPSTKPYTHSKS